jgi:hypothetical protein
MNMNTLGHQDVFEPYYEGRKNAFATIDAKAVERAKLLKERFEKLLSRAERNREHDEAA